MFDLYRPSESQTRQSDQGVIVWHGDDDPCPCHPRRFRESVQWAVKVLQNLAQGHRIEAVVAER